LGGKGDTVRLMEAVGLDDVGQELDLFFLCHDFSVADWAGKSKSPPCGRGLLLGYWKGGRKT
jgi:hypothetical protein